MWRAAIVACGLALGAHSAGAAEITQADFAAPTDRYTHGILGDAIEYGALVLRLSNGKTLRMVLPETRVFEDLAPRLADVDGDGAPEVIVVETDTRRGAQLAVYDDTGKIAATPYIGTRNRWLSPIGVGDLDGDGLIELAYVDRPHLAKTIRIWRFRDGALHHVADAPGFTNHRIGEDYISGGLRQCGGAPEMIVVDANWRQVQAVTFTGGQFSSRTIGPFTGRDGMQAALACPQ